MKGYCLKIAILLLTLSPLACILDNGYGAACAQDLTNEIGYECEDDEYGRYISIVPCDYVPSCRTQCPNCGVRMDCDEFEDHVWSCYYYCGFCGQSMTDEESIGHNCLDSGNFHCPFCQRELAEDEVCDCQGPIITPNSGGGSGGGTTGGATGTGNGNVVGMYSDTEDKTSGDNSGGYTVQDILDWARGRSKTLRDIIDKLEKEGRIKVVSGNSTCHYNPQTKVIILPEDVSYSVESVTHEIIHYLQDENGMLNIDSCGSDNEYQAYVLNRIFNKAYGEDAVDPRGIEDSTQWDVFIQRIKQYTKKKSDYVLYDKRLIVELEALNHKGFSESFRNYYKDLDDCYEVQGLNRKHRVYYENHDSNYKWNWEKILNDMGFIKR